MVQKIEQRQDTRVGVKGSFAVSIETDSESKLGLLTDISRGGLAFRYVDSDYKSISHGKACRLVILNSDRKVFMSGINARVVYDRNANDEYSFSLLKMNKIGIKFIELEFHQANRIELLLGSSKSQDNNLDLLE